MFAVPVARPRFVGPADTEGEIWFFIPQHIHQRSFEQTPAVEDRKSTRLNSSHQKISYAVFCLKKKKKQNFFFFFFFNDTATTEIYTLSLHDALPIYLVFYPAAYPSAVFRADACR